MDTHSFAKLSVRDASRKRSIAAIYPDFRGYPSSP
jgi:hypothetical protein